MHLFRSISKWHTKFHKGCKFKPGSQVPQIPGTMNEMTYRSMAEWRYPSPTIFAESHRDLSVTLFLIRFPYQPSAMNMAVFSLLQMCIMIIIRFLSSFYKWKIVTQKKIPVAAAR